MECPQGRSYLCQGERRRLSHAMETSILSLTTPTTLSLGRSRLTKENELAVQEKLPSQNLEFSVFNLLI